MELKPTPMPTKVTLDLPDWIADFAERFQEPCRTDEERMRLAIDLARANCSHGTGGPFGAAIFRDGDGAVVSVGVNRVLPLTNSTAHAEMLAFMLAQKALGQHRLDEREHRFILATSAQPCAMCYGATPWAGIHRLLIGARKEDVEKLTPFDEGPLPRNWIAGLARRNIEVTRDVLRREACEVLKAYAEGGSAY
jgi:tRNA(Arg) A34 adenosine deaminase TadA